MATHLRVSVYILCLTLAVSICRGDIRDIVTKDVFYNIVFGDITLSAEVGGIVTIFNEILSGASDNCTGKNFYKYGDFINATSEYLAFGITRDSDSTKREIAAFFAHVTFMTHNLCYVEAINKTCEWMDREWKDCCATDPSHLPYPCTAGKQYYGRGLLQIVWNDNYATAGSDLGFDGLNDPDIVARDGIISWKTALWLWMKRTSAHAAITDGRGFGETINAFAGSQGSKGYCYGVSDNAVDQLISRYSYYCGKLGVNANSIGNITCPQHI